MPRPKKFYDDTGLARVTLKKGSPRQPGGARAHGQYVQADGRRVNAHGLPIARTSAYAFPSIVWDLEDDPEDLGENADEVFDDVSAEVSSAGLDFDEVAALAHKSPTLLAGLQSLDAIGFALAEGPRGEDNLLIVGAARVLIDPALAAKHTLTGVVAREVGRALSLTAKVGARGRDRASFVQQNTELSLREEGEALLFAETVRAEILAASGPDIGVPGASGAALLLCAAVREGGASRTEAALTLGRGSLAPQHDDASSRYQELWARVFDLAMGDAGALS